MIRRPRPAFHLRPPCVTRGIALVVVLWVVTLLVIIAGSFVYSVRSAVLTTANLVSVAKARALADAGVYRGLYELSRPASDAERWQADGRERVFTLGQGEIHLVMVSESAKIDLNTANDALLKGLLLSAGASEEDAVRLLDAILDWRDADDLPRPQGAERDAYEAAGRTYLPANAPFQSVKELQRVLGITPELFGRIEGALTVYSGQPGITSTLASRQVLLALPGASAEDVDAYLAQRAEMLAGGLVPTPFPAAAGFETAAAAQVYNLTSTAIAADGTRFVREVVAKESPDPKRPFILLTWQEGRL
ncbi:general secretion pathway protein GspK [Immundisolibacter sp.]